MNEEQDLVYLKTSDTDQMINLKEFRYFVTVDDIENWEPVPRNIAEIAVHNRKIPLTFVESK